MSDCTSLPFTNRGALAHGNITDEERPAGSLTLDALLYQLVVLLVLHHEGWRAAAVETPTSAAI